MAAGRRRSPTPLEIGDSPRYRFLDSTEASYDERLDLYFDALADGLTREG